MRVSFFNVEYLGVHFVGPEGDACLILRDPHDSRVLPIWVGPDVATTCAARDSGMSPRRPNSYDLLASVLLRRGGVREVRIESYYEGVFIATIVANDEEMFDARPSDAIQLAGILDVPLLVDEDVYTQASVRISPNDAQEYLGIDLPAADQGSPEHEIADEDFQAILAEMGVTEDDIDLGGEDAGGDADEDPGEKQP